MSTHAMPKKGATPVSPTDKPLSMGAALYVMGALFEDEAKRIESLTDDELRAEIEARAAKRGCAPWKPGSTEELLARVKARAERKAREPR